ncbi:MAG: transposase [Acidimicrobiales bacterium]
MTTPDQADQADVWVGLDVGKEEHFAEADDVIRFADGDKLASYAGPAPVTGQSGKSTNGGSKTRPGNHRLKNAMSLAALRHCGRQSPRPSTTARGRKVNVIVQP